MSNIKLFLVDDDALYLKALEIEFLENANFEIETFQSGEAVLIALDKKPDIIILDYHLNSIDKDAKNGLQTLDAIKKINPSSEVIMLSSQDKIEVAIECMHHKALDYVIKSETAFLRLKKIISQLFLVKKMEKQLNWYLDRI
jgi:two-component system, OmpR family, response regulator